MSVAGDAKFAPLTSLSDDDFTFSLRNKLMGQVNLVRYGMSAMRDGGSFTLTSGVLAQTPMVGSGAVSLVNAGLEGFVRAAALEAPRGIRVNVVSPPWVTETLIAFKNGSGGRTACGGGRAFLPREHRGEADGRGHLTRSGASRLTRLRWFDRRFDFTFPADLFLELFPELFPELLDRLRGTPLRLAERVAHFDSAAKRVRIEGWSVQEHAGHSADLDRVRFRPRFAEFQRGEATHLAAHPRLNVPMRLVDLMLFVAEHDEHHLASITELGRIAQRAVRR